jgi:HPt (histidine-containing phosphotransfer) domain-containing protein
MTGKATTADELPYASHSAETLDASQIDCLLEVAGVAGVNEIMSAFWKSTEALLAALRIAIEKGDQVEAGRIAHALKGSAANVGASLLSGIARDAELAAKRGDFAAARAASEAAPAAYDATRHAVASRIAAFEQR